MYHFLILLLVVGIALPTTGYGQDLTPRTYWPAPRGTEIIVLGYAYQTGDVVTDPSLPIVGVDSEISSGVLAWQKTLGHFGRTTNFQIELPYADGTTRGDVEGLASRRHEWYRPHMAIRSGSWWFDRKAPAFSARPEHQS